MNNIRAWAEIDIGRIAQNTAIIRKIVPVGTKLLAAVKADAYGHGAKEVAQTMLANGADILGVALCEEGIKLRQSGITAPILIMSYTPKPLLNEVLRYGLIQTIFSVDCYEDLADITATFNAKHNQAKQAEVHIKIDTGMGRLGFLPTTSAADDIFRVFCNNSLNVTGIYTHFATSDLADATFMYHQFDKFNNMLALLATRKVPVNRLIKHVGNSGMLAQSIKTNFAPQVSTMFLDMVRIGILLYGLPPSADMASVCNTLGLLPAMRLMTRISMTKTLPAGSGISYGHTFVTNRETLVATLPIGYADGFHRTLSNKATVLVRGFPAPVIGAICMDQCMIDVTDVPNAQKIKPGEPVVIFGEPNHTATDLASLIGTIGYELICGVGKRVPRIYL